MAYNYNNRKGPRATKPSCIQSVLRRFRRMQRTEKQLLVLFAVCAGYLYYKGVFLSNSSASAAGEGDVDEQPPWQKSNPGEQKEEVHVVSDADFKLLDDFKHGRNRLAAAAAQERDRRKKGPPSRMGELPDIYEGKAIADGNDNGETTLSREEALAKKVQSKAEAEEEKQKGYRDNAFNQYVSDRISLHRDLHDPRSQWCKERHYDLSVLTEQVSLVIVFHNEARSTLLRTVWSALDKSPPGMLKEVILVDDASTMEHLHQPLTDEVETIPKTRLVRLQNRSGLIRARIAGAEAATGDILVVLDSHCECNHGWLEPLVERIHENRTNVVTPVIDGIDQHTWKYLGGPDTTTRGVFSWSLVFTWLDLPYAEAQKRHNPSAPLASPTMAGGLFAMDLQYFWDLGAYDLGMDVWGGENLEISFRIWMCGGRLEILQCSRVGHVFRDHHPYKFPDGFTTIKKNANRVAEVWLDEYKSIYDEVDPASRSVPTGDVSSRVALRKQLNCKSFKWYLENVFPDMFVPQRSNVIAAGTLRNTMTSMCVVGGTKTVSLRPCTAEAQASLNSRWYFVKDVFEIRYEASQGAKCIDSSKHAPLGDVELWGCHGLKGNQEWHYADGNRLKHGISGLCMAVHTNKLVVNTCTTGKDPNQEWKFNKWYPGDGLE
eukprot:m.354731 g.354731  ORF g.354731 m.354731 type:complete len:659 (+) comp20722_c0_seq1:281-2257(+)